MAKNSNLYHKYRSHSHTEQSEVSIQNTEHGKQNTDYSHTDKLTLHSHTERSEVSKDKSVNLLNHLDSLDSSVASLPQNDDVYNHTDKLHSHTEQSEVSIQNTEHGKQNTDYSHTDKLTLHSHTERSEVSKDKSVNLLNHLDSLDSSVASLPQNDDKTSLPQNDNAKVCNDGARDAQKRAPKLAIVIPCYNEEAVIAHTYKALNDKLNSLITQKIISKESFLCFVDDGSKDKTCEILLSLKSAKNSIDNAHNHTEGIALHNHTERSEVSIQNTEHGKQNTDYSHNDKLTLHSHTERSEVSKDKSVNLLNHLDSLDSSVASLPQNDNNDICLDSSVASLPQNDDVYNHTDKLHSHTEQSEVSIQNTENGKQNTDYNHNDNETILHQNDNINPHKIVKLTKNYGQQNALLAGLDFVKDKCDCVVSIDGDLQQDINAIDEMIDKFKNGAEVVYGVRKAYTNESVFKKYTSFGFYHFMRLLGVNILNNHIEYRLLSARACKNLLEFREVNLFLRGIVPLLGYKSEVVYYAQNARLGGESKYSFMSLFSLAWDAITSFSIMPLRIMSAIGVILCALSVIYGAYALYMKFFTTEPISGWTSTILILLFFGGMQFLGLGIIGEYIGKIYAEVKHRPRYFVDEIL